MPLLVVFEVQGPTTRLHREPDRRAVQIGDIEPIGADLATGVGDVEKWLVAGKAKRAATAGVVL